MRRIAFLNFFSLFWATMLLQFGVLLTSCYSDGSLFERIAMKPYYTACSLVLTFLHSENQLGNIPLAFAVFISTAIFISVITAAIGCVGISAMTRKYANERKSESVKLKKTDTGRTHY